jgi:LCP family protein required for cell wall assembly
VVVRTSRRALLAGALGLPLLAACTGEGSTSGRTSAPSSPSATRGVTVSGGDAALAAAVREVYAGRTGVAATVTTGAWDGTGVAVATAGADATLLVGSGGGWKVAGGWWPSMERPEPRLGATPRFVLVIGSDARKGQALRGSRADTLQVVGIDGAGGGGVLGIARDVWARMPGGGSAKINAAFGRGGGPAQAEAVQRLTGLPISGYVVTGFGGFVDIVDELGGLPIVLPTAIRGEASGVDLAGPQRLSGAEALAYARERKVLPDGDFGRSRHQGDLILAAAVAARLRGVGWAPTAMDAVSGHSQTDLGVAEALTFAAAFYRLDPRRVGHVVAKGGFGRSADGQSIVLLDAASKRAFERFRDGRL